MILSATRWNTNGDLIADVARLGYIRPADVVLDATYGRGNWWTRYRPDQLIAHDARTDGVDFRQLPEADATINVVALDPPYIAQGGRRTSTTPDFLDRFGLVTVPRTPRAVDELIRAGITEAARVLTPAGILLLKSMNYVTGGRYHPGAYNALDAAHNAGLRLIDELIHLRAPGPQPTRARQLHARRNYSMLFVFQKPRTPPGDTTTKLRKS